jgi:hypothetical protein
MARAGKKYPLIVYQHMLNRWWPAMITLGLGMFGIAYAEYLEPMAPFLPWRWQLAGSVGVLAVLVGLFFIIAKQFAYVRPQPNKRIRKTTATEMHFLFPKNSMSGWVQDIFAPLSSRTALVIELTGYPVSPRLLRLFLSRFFFKDKTPHLVILVQDWMSFSAELESMRSGVDPNPPGQKRPPTSILSRLPQK